METQAQPEISEAEKALPTQVEPLNLKTTAQIDHFFQATTENEVHLTGANDLLSLAALVLSPSHGRLSAAAAAHSGS